MVERRRRRGRPRTRPIGGVTHDRRQAQSGQFPVHVTLRVRKSVDNLRKRRTFSAVRRALAGGKQRFGVRLVQYSVQRTHLHLVMEAADRQCLSRGMQGLGVRLAKAINRATGRNGAVFVERYHARRVKTALELRQLLAYVLNNARRHAAQYGRRYPDDWLDPCSSAPHFDGWYGRAPPPTADVATVPAKSELLRHAWRAYGLLDAW
jgi:putative transposase